MNSFTKKELDEMEASGYDFAKDFLAWGENQKKTKNELRQALEGSAPDMALTWSKDGSSYDVRAESAADICYEGMLKALNEKFKEG